MLEISPKDRISASRLVCNKWVKDGLKLIPANGEGFAVTPSISFKPHFQSPLRPDPHVLQQILADDEDRRIGQRLFDFRCEDERDQLPT